MPRKRKSTDGEPTSNDLRSLSTYLREIGVNSPLTYAEEEYWFGRYKRGDRAARDKIVESNLLFVVAVAKNEARKRFGYLIGSPEYGEVLNDLISEGNIGLLTALDRFDETKGFKFISYAVWWIRQAIILYSLNNNHAVRMPINRQEAHSLIKKIENSYFVNKGKHIPLIEIALESGLSESAINDALETAKKPIRLDAPISRDTETTGYDLMQDQNQKLPDKMFHAESLSDDVEDAIETLTPREAEVIRLYFGIGRETDMTLEEIGKQHGITRERARQIKEKAIRMLRHKSRGRKLRLHWEESDI